MADCRRCGHERLARHLPAVPPRREWISALAGLNLVLLHREAGKVFDRLAHTSWSLVGTSVEAGAPAMVMIVLEPTRGLRAMAAVAVSAVVGAWGWAQYPYLLPRTLTLTEGSATATALNAQLVIVVVAAVLVAASLIYLYWLRQHGRHRRGRRRRRTRRGQRRPVTAQR